MSGSKNMIGGTAAGARNLVSGNADAGIELFGNDATQNMVRGNLIGTDATGSRAVHNNTGVSIVEAPNNLIGGTTTPARNLTSGNISIGVSIFGSGAQFNVCTRQLRRYRHHGQPGRGQW